MEQPRGRMEQPRGRMEQPRGRMEQPDELVRQNNVEFQCCDFLGRRDMVQVDNTKAIFRFAISSLKSDKDYRQLQHLFVDLPGEYQPSAIWVSHFETCANPNPRGYVSTRIMNQVRQKWNHAIQTSQRDGRIAKVRAQRDFVVVVGWFNRAKCYVASFTEGPQGSLDFHMMFSTSTKCLLLPDKPTYISDEDYQQLLSTFFPIQES